MRNPIYFVAIALLALAVTVPATAHADSDAQAVVVAAQKKMMDLRFRTEMTSTSKGETSKATGEFDTMERMHMKTPDAEIIMVPEGVWMRSKGEGWMKPPIDMSGMFKQFMPKTVADIQKGMSNVKDEGMSTWQGKPTRVISYDMNTKVMGFSVKSHNRLWIDKSGLPIHSEVDSEAMGQKSHAVQDIIYDDSIRITAPK